MKLAFLRTDFPDGRSHILMRDGQTANTELNHFILVLSNKGTLWVDVFWPYDEESENATRQIPEQSFWQIFRTWRLNGINLGDTERVAQILARKQLTLKQRDMEV